MTPEEIRTVTFEKQMGGYRRDDVDAFLKQMADEMEKLQKEKDDMESKLYVLADKIETYRKDEDNVKMAMLNAQRMADSVVREAKKKSEEILRQAGIKADDVVQAAREQVEDEKSELLRLQGEVAKFKSDVMSLYRQHIESLATLPDAPAQPQEESQPEQEPEPAPLEETAAEPAPIPSAEPAPIPSAEPQEEPAAEEQPAEQPSEEAPAQEPGASSSFTLDLSGLMEESDEDDGAEKEAAAKASILDSFQGIKFSD